MSKKNYHDTTFSITINGRTFEVRIGYYRHINPRGFEANFAAENDKMFSILETSESKYAPYSHGTMMGDITWLEAQARMWAHINILMTGSHHLEYATEHLAQEGGFKRETRGFGHYE